MFLVTLVAKLLVHSPLKLQLVKSSSCISPKNMLLDPEASLLKLRTLLISCWCHTDTFLAEFLARNEGFKRFWFVCQFICTLSHGQNQI